MARIRHIAILSENPAKLAEFWRDVFGFKIVGVCDWGEAWVTDGYLHVALLCAREGIPTGINHWGVSIDEEERAGIYAKLKAMDLTPYPDPPTVIDGIEIEKAFVEDKAFDVDGNKFDLVTGDPEFRASRAKQRVD